LSSKVNDRVPKIKIGDKLQPSVEKEKIGVRIVKKVNTQFPGSDRHFFFNISHPDRVNYLA
jgi:hypothetical protein